MKKYKVTWQRTQNGKLLDWEMVQEIELDSPPKVGEGKALLVDPPIYEAICKVEEIEKILTLIIFNEVCEKRLTQYGIRDAFVRNFESHVQRHGIKLEALLRVLNDTTCWIVFISHAFFWQQTPEGIEFWRAISQIDYIQRCAETNEILK